MSVSFVCYFPAENPIFFTIQIPLNEWGSTLLERTQAKLHSWGRKEVEVADLRLFKVASTKSGKQPTDPQQTDVRLSPRKTLQSRALQWLHQQSVDNQIDKLETLSSVFPNGPHGSDLDIIIADTEGMIYSIFQSYLTDFLSVLEMTEGLGDPYDVYNRKLKKGAHVLADYRCLPFLFML